MANTDCSVNIALIPDVVLKTTAIESRLYAGKKQNHLKPFITLKKTEKWLKGFNLWPYGPALLRGVFGIIYFQLIVSCCTKENPNLACIVVLRSWTGTSRLSSPWASQLNWTLCSVIVLSSWSLPCHLWDLFYLIEPPHVRQDWILVLGFLPHPGCSDWRWLWSKKRMAGVVVWHKEL